MKDTNFYLWLEEAEYEDLEAWLMRTQDFVDNYPFEIDPDVFLKMDLVKIKMNVINEK